MSGLYLSLECNFDRRLYIIVYNTFYSTVKNKMSGKRKMGKYYIRNTFSISLVNKIYLYESYTILKLYLVLILF